MFFKKKFDKKIKNKINKYVEENEDDIIDETIDQAIYKSKEIIDQNLSNLFKKFFIKISINLLPVLIGLVIYISSPNNITKTILLVGYGISIIIGIYEFINFSIKTWYFFKPMIEQIIGMIKFHMFSLFWLKIYIKQYLQNEFINFKLYDEIERESKQRINKKLNENKLYQFVKKFGYKYQHVDEDADNIAAHFIYETSVPSVIWEEIIKYIKYLLLTKWLFAIILIIGYIVIFRLFILPIIIVSI